MAELNNCLLPDDLYYHIEFNVWVRDNGDGMYDVGMTDIAQTLVTQGAQPVTLTGALLPGQEQIEGADQPLPASDARGG